MCVHKVVKILKLQSVGYVNGFNNTELYKNMHLFIHIGTVQEKFQSFQCHNCPKKGSESTLCSNPISSLLKFYTCFIIILIFSLSDDLGWNTVWLELSQLRGTENIK